MIFGGELSPAARAVVAQLPYAFGGDQRRVLLHPLPLYNNSAGAHDMLSGGKQINELLSTASDAIRAMYIAGSLLPKHLQKHADALSNLDFVVVQELSATETTTCADVVLP